MNGPTANEHSTGAGVPHSGHDHHPVETPHQHDAHAGHAGHGSHDKYAGHDPETFRRRFWLTLLISLPVIATSEMIMDWFGYELSGVAWVGPVLGTFVFVWGGWPFLKGAVDEIRGRAPGMMLLIAMAITVAWASSMASSLGWFDLEFWWELAALVTIMLLGHWQEMKAIGQAQGALAALAALLPDDAEVIERGETRTAAVADLREGQLILVRAGGRVPADGLIEDGEASPPTRRSGFGFLQSATTRRLPGSSVLSPKPKHPIAGPRCWRTASPSGSSTSPPQRR
jgi:P-type Cu2+ transporter